MFFDLLTVSADNLVLCFAAKLNKFYAEAAYTYNKVAVTFRVKLSVTELFYVL